MGSVPEEWVTLHWAPTSCCSGQMLSHLSPPHQAPFRNRLPLGLLWVSDAVGAPSRDGTPQRGRRTQRRQKAGPFPRWLLPHRVAVESLGKPPLLTGLTVSSSTLCPRPPRPQPQLSYLLPIDEWFQLCEAHSSVTGEPSQWPLPASEVEPCNCVKDVISFLHNLVTPPVGVFVL